MRPWADCFCLSKHRGRSLPEASRVLFTSDEERTFASDEERALRARSLHKYIALGNVLYPNASLFVTVGVRYLQCLFITVARTIYSRSILFFFSHYYLCVSVVFLSNLCDNLSSYQNLHHHPGRLLHILGTLLDLLLFFECCLTFCCAQVYSG